jgi:ribulose-5-phosphate 4-epimerase/fuculose-1-phosphate aldolase
MEKNNKVKFRTIFLAKNFSKNRKIDLLIKWGKAFARMGIAPETKGNLSFRTQFGFIITGTGTVLGNLKPKDFVEVLRIERKKQEFTARCKGKIVPSMESLFHNEIYNLRPEINAVFHLHDNLVLTKGEKLKIPCTEKEQPAGSIALVEEIRKLLEKRKTVNYLIIKNHGVISLGKTLLKTKDRIKFFNKQAKNLKND